MGVVRALGRAGAEEVAGDVEAAVGAVCAIVVGERLGLPQCTKAQIDTRLDELYRLGLRSMFVAHWVDNAFAGAALEPGAEGQFISAMQVQETGQPFATEPCN